MPQTEYGRVFIYQIWIWTSIHRLDSQIELNTSIRWMAEYLPSILVWSWFKAHTRKIKEIEENDRRKLLTLLVRFHFQWQKKSKKAPRERERERESFLRAYLIERESEPARARERERMHATMRERERDRNVGFSFHSKWNPNRNFGLTIFFSTVGVGSVRYFGIRYTFGEP